MANKITFNSVALNDGTSAGGLLQVDDDKGLLYTLPATSPLQVAWKSIAKAKKGAGHSKTKVRVILSDDTVHNFVMATEEDAQTLKEHVKSHLAREAPASLTEAMDFSGSEFFDDEEQATPLRSMRNGHGPSMARIAEHPSNSYAPVPLKTGDESTPTATTWKPSNTTLLHVMILNMVCCGMMAIIVISLLSVVVHRTGILFYGTTTYSAPTRSVPAPAISMPDVDVDIPEDVGGADIVVPTNDIGNCDPTSTHCVGSGDTQCILLECDFNCNQYAQSMFVSICPTCAEIKSDYCNIKTCCPSCMESRADPLAKCKIEQGTSDECSFEEISAC